MAKFDDLLKHFCAGVIASNKLTLPVRIEVMDIGTNTFYEITATSKEEGTYLFSNGHPVGEGGARTKPWRVRFTGSGPEEKPFVIDFPAS
jgi:hypothetical protein